ncbi:hypothetical protein DV735_g558, partial [Chaetothyriales sp. CBS 134920]
MATVLVRGVGKKGHSDGAVVSEHEHSKTAASSSEEISSKVDLDTLNLGAPGQEKRFWWQRGKSYDPNAIATQPSVFDDAETAKMYQPRADWENLHRFDPSARWTWGEEYAVIRKIDLRIMIFACIMFMALELDRSNLSQALTDNFLGDLGMNTNDYNWGNTVFKLSFLLAELPSQLVSKWMGPDRWIPTQMMILYLSYFYKHAELSIRLSFWWTAMSTADILAAFLGFGLLHLRGHLNYAGWRWLFLIEGLFTLVLGLSAFLLMPPGPTQTANWARGKKGWFTEREEVIMVNRVLREDPSKSTMHNRQPITPKLLWKSLSDYDLWPIYLLGLNFQTPMGTPSLYLTLSLKQLGFGTFKTNLLVIPSQVGHIITLLAFTYLSEIFGQLWLWGALAQIWALPCLAYLNAVDINSINKWSAFAVMTVFLAYPSVHAIQVYYTLRNRSRDRKWNAMTEEQRAEYLATTTDEGNKRLDFRFAT